MGVPVRWWVVVSFALGCAPAPDGPTPRFDLAPARFFDAPWPSDLRRDDDGTIAWAGFPDPIGDGLLSQWIAFGEDQVGFGTNAPIYVGFDGPLDLTRLPDPAASIADDAALFLLDVDPRSPTWGARVPVVWRVATTPTAYEDVDLLAVAPLPGFPLRPHTTYALVVTTRLAQPSPTLAVLWEEAGYAALRDALTFHGTRPDEVAVATVFTTTDPTDEMARIADFLRYDVAPPQLSLPLEWVAATPWYDVYRTHYPTPRLTHGVRPYLTDGGGFRFAADGDPLVEGWDDLRLAVCVPKDRTAPPPAGYPVALTQHGTGGDFLSHCDLQGYPEEIAAQLAREGIVTLGIDQPLHGTRDGGSPSDLANFNVLNPESGAANFRQGAADAIYLAHALAGAPTTFRLPDGAPLSLDPARVLYFGHSQGGITGAIAAPFFGDDVQAAVLSGAGGVLTITLEVRKDPIDFAATFASLLGFQPDEALTPLHPAMALVQTLSERTDPINYAPYWFQRRAPVRDAAPLPVLLTSGTDDAMTPYETALALGAAGGLDLVAPAATASLAHALAGLRADRSTLSDNATAWDGSAVTAGLLQVRDGSHFIVWESPDARDAYRTFLATAAGGAPVLAGPIP